MQERKALSHIKAIIETPAGEYGPRLFVDHHLEELSQRDWLDATGRATPTPSEVLDALILRDAWDSGEDGTIDTYDFTLPGDVTDYVLSVRFDGDTVADVSMES